MAAFKIRFRGFSKVDFRVAQQCATQPDNCAATWILRKTAQAFFTDASGKLQPEKENPPNAAADFRHR